MSRRHDCCCRSCNPCCGNNYNNCCGGGFNYGPMGCGCGFGSGFGSGCGAGFGGYYNNPLFFLLLLDTFACGGRRRW